VNIETAQDTRAAIGLATETSDTRRDMVADKDQPVYPYKPPKLAVITEPNLPLDQLLGLAGQNTVPLKVSFCMSVRRVICRIGKAW